MKMTRAKRSKIIYNIVTFALVIGAFFILQSMIDAKTISRSLKGQLVPICCWIVMAVSLNLVIGISGELSLGHAGFMSVGAYTGAVISGVLVNLYGVQDTTLRLVIAIAAGGVMAGIVGALIGIPVLRLRGDYLAIVTLAFGEIIRNLVNVLYIGTGDGRVYSSILNKKLPEGVTMLVDGAKGAVKIKPISTFMAGFILILITLVVVLNLVNSRAGRAIKATRDNRIAAESMGVNVTKYKMMAFVTAAVLAGMAGALYGLNSSTVVPTQFTFNQSINVLVFVVLGGLGNILGSVISATALTVLPEVLRAFADYRMLVYAVVLILVMIFTNNPTIRAITSRLFAPLKSFFRRAAKYAPAVGGAVKELGGEEEGEEQKHE
ncbi:MAG: branched-chain amino acid ABC transporter permease [Clostridia bacterium]|nr:branched-chain amino acid ABC transporter permease [Clostridia bacterium]